MRLLPIALLVAVLGCAAKDRAIAPAAPKDAAPADLAQTVGNLPKYITFSISGVAFLDSRLFATTNVGLLEFDGDGGLTAFYRWYSDFNTVSGPWKDAANNAIWVFRDDDGRFVRLDAGRNWGLFDLPAPPRGRYSRGDILQGFSIVPTAGQPRLLGSGSVWQLQGGATWSLLPTPKAPEFSPIQGYARLPDQELFLVSPGACALPPCNIEAHRLKGGAWQQPVQLPVGAIRQTVQVGQATFVRGAQGRLVAIADGNVSLVETPGPCEAITATTSGHLLASFRDHGVFEHDGASWIKRFDAPYARFEGEHWVYLAEEAGHVALATTAVPNFKPGTTSDLFYTGATALWLTQGERFQPVELKRR